MQEIQININKQLTSIEGYVLPTSVFEVEVNPQSKTKGDKSIIPWHANIYLSKTSKSNGDEPCRIKGIFISDKNVRGLHNKREKDEIKGNTDIDKFVYQTELKNGKIKLNPGALNSIKGQIIKQLASRYSNIIEEQDLS